eukprot:m51a1_g845 putative ribosomal rna-processing protein 8 (465) ;mRNA; f:770929-772529
MSQATGDKGALSLGLYIPEGWDEPEQPAKAPQPAPAPAARTAKRVVTSSARQASAKPAAAPQTQPQPGAVQDAEEKEAEQPTAEGRGKKQKGPKPKPEESKGAKGTQAPKDTKGKGSNASNASKDSKDIKGSKGSKGGKDSKDIKGSKGGKDSNASKDSKDSKGNTGSNGSKGSKDSSAGKEQGSARAKREKPAEGGKGGKALEPAAKKQKRAEKAPAPAQQAQADHADSGVPQLDSIDDEDMSPLQRKMLEKLRGSRFRQINEQLYTSSGERAFEQFQADPSLFTLYHEGYQRQVKEWPEDPLDRIINALKSREPGLVVADFGCGVARLAKEVRHMHTVHSFDLVAANEFVTACNIADVPLETGTADVGVFCLSLMGTDFIKFLREGTRVLKKGGYLLIAEPKSRIPDVAGWVKGVEALGFRLITSEDDNAMFIVFTFQKVQTRRALLGGDALVLKPCLYKRR